MSRVETPVLEKQTELEERFRYGWRDVRRRMPDGSYQYLQLPLTLYDVLHPQECDKIMNNTRHDTEIEYLAVVLKDRYRQDSSVLVLRDVGVYWDTPGLGHHSPDISVIFNIDRPRPMWTSFHVAREGVRPLVIFESVSPSTREGDKEAKVVEYHRAEVPWYVIIDRENEDDPPTLLVHRWMADKYVLMDPDDNGFFMLDQLGLKLGVVEGRIALFDAETGQELGNYSAIKEALDVEMAARQAAEERANSEAKRANVASKRAEAASKRAETETKRADAASKRAEAEAKRALMAEQLAAELQQRLRDMEERRRNGPNGPPQS